MPMTMVGVMPRMVPGVITAGVAPCAVVRPCGSGRNSNRERKRTQRQRKNTKRPAERNQLKHL